MHTQNIHVSRIKILTNPQLGFIFFLMILLLDMYHKLDTILVPIKQK